MKAVRFNIYNHLAEKFDIQLYVVCFFDGEKTLYQANWEESIYQNMCDYGDCGKADYDNLRDAIYWLESVVGEKITKLLMNQDAQGKIAKINLDIINSDGFIIS